jgi:hypothetical protein
MLLCLDIDDTLNMYYYNENMRVCLDWWSVGEWLHLRSFHTSLQSVRNVSAMLNHTIIYDDGTP